MKFRMPYVYKALVKPPKARNFVQADFGGYVDLDLAEASDDEAPIALIWNKRDPHSRVEMTMTGRLFAGRFHTAVTNEDGSYMRATSIESEDIHRFAHVGPYSDPKPIDLFRQGKLTKSISDFRETTNSDEEEVLSAVRESSSDILIVDGIVYKPQPVPVIVAGLELFGDSRRVKLSLFSTDQHDPHWATMHFPVQCAAEAKEWADAYAFANPVLRVGVTDVTGIEFVDGTLLPEQDLFVTDLRAVVDNLLKASGKTLFVMPDEYIDAWQDLRLVRRSLVEGCPRNDIDRVMAAWEEFLRCHDAVEEAKHRKWGTPYLRENQSEHEVYAYFLPRWENAEIGLDFSPPDTALPALP